MKHVYLLWHIHEFDDGDEDSKLLGIFSTEEIAKSKIAYYQKLPGFSESLEGFEISKYEIDYEYWQDGFVTES